MVSLITALQKVRKAYNEGGSLLVLRRVMKCLFRTNSAWWFIMDLSTPVPEFPPPLIMDVVNNRIDEVIKYMRRKDYISDQELVVGKETGHWFLGLVVEGEIVGFCKCGFKRVYVNDFRNSISLPDDVAFIYEYEVDEALRGRGAGRWFISQVLRMLRDRGFRFAICHIPPWNIPSIRIMEKCGFRRLKLVRFIEFVGISWKSRNINAIIQETITNVRSQ